MKEGRAPREEERPRTGSSRSTPFAGSTREGSRGWRGIRFAKLAHLLRAFTLAFPLSTAAGLQAARGGLLLLQPYCFRAHDAMADYFGVSTQHVTNMIGPQAMEQFLSEATLRDRRSAPGGRRKASWHGGWSPGEGQAARRGGLTRGAESEDEPAWGALGHMVHEKRPSCTSSTALYFTKVMLAGPGADDLWTAARPEVEGHRYAPYLESLAQSGDATPPKTLTKFAGRGA